MKNQNLKVEAKVKAKVNYNEDVIRYAYGNSKLKTWFITKDKRAKIPEGSVLLFMITGENTNLPIFTKDNYPVSGDVISDIDSVRLLVKFVEWI